MKGFKITWFTDNGYSHQTGEEYFTCILNAAARYHDMQGWGDNYIVRIVEIHIDNRKGEVTG